MACMCGDTHCGSCGPAQGNWRCDLCGAWADDGCEHFDAETGEVKPEFAAAMCDAIDRQTAEAAEAFMESMDDQAPVPGEKP